MTCCTCGTGRGCCQGRQDGDGSEERPVCGGHAVCAVGYDDFQQCFIVRNSWGEDWGDQGYFYMPYEYICHPQLAQDFWAINLGGRLQGLRTQQVRKTQGENQKDRFRFAVDCRIFPWLMVSSVCG
ncbi:unnamed protein product [Durusdinium trenchii]|uniref:Peptidase C1A papain C-terminal domain-containing protein n=1 Tax=Durusdinium trenchii TaxID=1381693 RepID=A0ABP0KX97_9DINO